MVGPAASPTLYFVHADHLERVQKITDASQTIVWDGQFTPYGRTHAITGTVQNPLRFPGQWADPAANYFYNYMRDYDPTLARYLSSDLVGTRGGRNKFSYAGANPLNTTDPLGLFDPNPHAGFYGRRSFLTEIGASGGGLIGTWRWGTPPFATIAGTAAVLGAAGVTLGSSAPGPSSQTGPGSQPPSPPPPGGQCPPADDPCEKAKGDANRIYNLLTDKRIPQYVSGGTRGRDIGHYRALQQAQRGLEKAMSRVRYHCPILPDEYILWLAAQVRSFPPP